MHHIQRQILNVLMHAPSLGYAQLRPKGVESNHFAYHLGQLIRAELVAKKDRRYSLTTEGLVLADRVSHQDMNIRKQPHIVTSICITNSTGQTLLFKHNFQPYLNLVGFPQGRIHYQERVGEAAIRELAEKTGLQGIDLTHRGMIYVHATKQGEDISKILAHVFTGTITGTPSLTAEDSRKGTSFWDDAAKYAEKACMPGFWRVKELLQSSPENLFFAETEVEMA